MKRLLLLVLLFSNVAYGAQEFTIDSSAAAHDKYVEDLRREVSCAHLRDEYISREILIDLKHFSCWSVEASVLVFLHAALWNKQQFSKLQWLLIGASALICYPTREADYSRFLYRVTTKKGKQQTVLTSLADAYMSHAMSAYAIPAAAIALVVARYIQNSQIYKF